MYNIVMSDNISLSDYVNKLDILRENAYMDLQINPTNQVLQEKATSANVKHKLGLTALELAMDVKVQQDGVDLENAKASLANNIAKEEKTLYDAALAKYTTTPSDINKTAKDIASLKYDVKLKEAVEAASKASILTVLLNEAIDIANKKALDAGYIFPIALPSDQVILETLTQLITEGCIDVSEIQQKISEIITTSSTFNTFIEKMSIFNDYESVLELRLRQIFNFLTEDGIIDSQEAIITTLRHEIILAINTYKNAIVNNNSLATQVNSLYNDVEERLDNLHLISSEMSHTMQDVEKLIILKRGGHTFAQKVVFVPIRPNTYTKQTPISLVTTNMKAIPDTSTYQMRYNFMYNDLTKTLTYTGTDALSVVTVDIKLEVMSTSANAYDTSTMCTVILLTPVGRQREVQISCITASGRIAINKNEKIQFCFNETDSILIKQGMITLCLC